MRDIICTGAVMLNHFLHRIDGNEMLNLNRLQRGFEVVKLDVSSLKNQHYYENLITLKC
jgi:hypothetical protein